MKIDSKTMQQVRLDDFDIEDLRRAASEGRLYIKPSVSSVEKAHEASVSAIMEYVERIDECVNIEYREYIHGIWRMMLADATIGPKFFYYRYASNRGKPNWCRVNAIVFVLRENGVYSKDYTAVDLHLRMEKASRRTSAYTSSPKFYPDRKEILLIRQMIILTNTDDTDKTDFFG